MSVINLDTAALLDITIRAGHSLDLQLPFYQADGTTPLVLAGTFKMNVNDAQNADTPVMTLTQASGLSVSSNVLSISRNVIFNTLTKGTYYYDIRNDLAGNLSVPVLYGRIIVNPNITPA